MKRRARWRLSSMNRWRLANRLAFSMVLVAAIAIAILFYDINRTNRQEIEAVQTNNLITSTQELSKGLDALVLSEKGRMSNLALSRSVVEFIAARPDQRSALFTPTLADFTNFIDSGRFYRAVLLIDRGGEVLISTEGSYVGQRFSNSTFFRQASQGEVYMSDPGISRLDRKPVIWLAAPVYAQARPVLETAPRPAPDGVVTVALSPEWLWDYVQQFHLGQAGYAMLIDQYGIRLAHGGDRHYIFRSLAPLAPETWATLQAEDRFGPLPRIVDTNSRPLLDYIHSNPLPQLLIGQPGTSSERVYYSAARMQARDWTVVAMLSEREILAPANRVTLRGLAATLIVSVLLGLTVWWVTQRILRTVPLLAQAATKIAHGDLSTPIAVQGSSELHALSENFEVMRQRLQESHTELATWASSMEQRVVRRSQELAALSEIIAFASRTQSRNELLQTALHHTLQVMGAQMGGIWLADAVGALHLMASEGLSRALSEPLMTFAPGEGVLGEVQDRGVPVAFDDISQAPQLARAAVKAQGLHAFAAVPLRIHGRTLGVIALASRSREGFTPEAVALAASIAQQIALTLDNIALVEQVQAQARDVARLQERERIAGDIHDSIAQTLSYLHLQTDRLANQVDVGQPGDIREHLIQMQGVLAAASGDVRRFISGLHEIAPPPACLSAHLRNEVARLAGELAMRVEVACEQGEDLLISPSTGAELARIVGEALRNAQRHGRADTAQVVLRCSGGGACLSISDNGAGFDPDQPPSDGRRHFGLRVMRARAARIGGDLRITSRPGAGTTIQVHWPVTDEDRG